MSENPLDPSPKFRARVKTLAHELWRADGSPEGRMDEFLERADELARMENAGATGLEPNPMTLHEAIPGVIVEEAFIQDNLGEFPSGQLGDEGRFRQTPMTREQMRKTDEGDLPEGGLAP